MTSEAAINYNNYTSFIHSARNVWSRAMRFMRFTSITVTVLTKLSYEFLNRLGVFFYLLWAVRILYLGSHRFPYSQLLLLLLLPPSKRIVIAYVCWLIT